MKTTVLKVSPIGKFRGILLPSQMLRKYCILDSVVAEERADEIVLRASRSTQTKLTWAETYKQMAIVNEDWAEWEGVAADGLEETPWNEDAKSKMPSSHRKAVSRRNG